MPRLRLSIIALLLSGAVAADYITDRVTVGLHDDPGLDGTPGRLLDSGTDVEVLQRDEGRVEVELADGSRGWIDARYVSEEVPVTAQLRETRARLRQMGLELAALRERQAADTDSAADTAELQAALAGAQARIDAFERGQDQAVGDAGARLAALQRRVDEAVALLAGSGGTAPDMPPPATTATGWIERYRAWLIGGIALIVGFVAGAAFVDHRFRRRHGGFRL